MGNTKKRLDTIYKNTNDDRKKENNASMEFEIQEKYQLQTSEGIFTKTIL